MKISNPAVGISQKRSPIRRGSPFNDETTNNHVQACTMVLMDIHGAGGAPGCGVRLDGYEAFYWQVASCALRSGSCVG